MNLLKEIVVSSPSNIALIKYMGKKELLSQTNLLNHKNIPENPSLSLTLNHFKTSLSIKESNKEGDVWETSEKSHPLLVGEVPHLHEDGKKRFLDFLNVLRQEFKKEYSFYKEFDFTTANPPSFTEDEKVLIKVLNGLSPLLIPQLNTSVQLESRNTFPHSAGIASSASAFSALTYGFFQFYFQNEKEFLHFLNTHEGKVFLSRYSRMGSGSSARSFEGPFVSWENDKAFLIPSKLPALKNCLLITGTSPKKISSSEAHRRCKTSPLWDERVKSIPHKHHSMKKFIENGDFYNVSKMAYEEFLEMHELFHTCSEPFTYFNEMTLKLLDQLKKDQSYLMKTGIYTMDAGPNIHCLVPTEYFEEIKRYWRSNFPEVEIRVDEEGVGACNVL